MPSLAYAQALGSRASKVGFEWDDFDGVLDKVREEIDELQKAETPQEREAEYGDVLFTLVNVARWLKVDAEDSLRSTGHKFRARGSGTWSNSPANAAYRCPTCRSTRKRPFGSRPSEW